MKTNKYKILVLSDLKNTDSVLKSTISLAKMIDGEIALFHVKKPTDIVGNDNQLSAMRTINSEYSSTQKKIRDLIQSFSNEYVSDIKFNFSFGNIKEEIGNYIDEIQPDIIVLGKRKSNPLSLIGDNITQFVMKKHKGAVMIVADQNVLEPNKEISIGVLNNIEKALKLDFVDDLLQNTNDPLKSFKVVNKSSEIEESVIPIDQKVVEFVFEKNDNTIKTLSNYLSKNNINLLCLNREKVKSQKQASTITPDIKDVISKLNVSILVSNN